MTLLASGVQVFQLGPDFYITELYSLSNELPWKFKYSIKKRCGIQLCMLSYCMTWGLLCKLPKWVWFSHLVFNYLFTELNFSLLSPSVTKVLTFGFSSKQILRWGQICRSFWQKMRSYSWQSQGQRLTENEHIRPWCRHGSSGGHPSGKPWIKGC